MPPGQASRAYGPETSMGQNSPDRVDPVVEKVRARLHERSQLGIKKYGTTLAENPQGGSRRYWLNHALEEALDLANYLQAELMRMDEAEIEEAIGGERS